MSNWDAIFGEAALGLDPAKVELVRADSGQAPARRSQRSSMPDQQRDRPAEQAATTNPEAIFRREALEFRVRGRDTPGGVVRLGARWIHWGYRMMLFLVVVAVAGMWVIRTGESTSGPAVIDGRTGTVAVLLPAVAAPDLASSHGLTVTLPGGRSAGISGLHAQLASATAVRKAGLAPLTQPGILVTGQLNPGAAAVSVAQDARLRTQASVVLRSESLADVLGRQFGAMLGSGTAP